MGDRNFSADDVTEIMSKVSQLDITKMSLSDQLLFMMHVVKFAEAMKPLVDKYSLPPKQKNELFDELLQYFRKSDAEPHSADIKPEDDEEMPNAEN